MLAAGAAQGAIIYSGSVGQSTVDDGSPIYFDLNPNDGYSQEYEVFFDGSNSTSKPCVLGNQTQTGPTPYVFNELDMYAAGNDSNGVPVIPLGTTITDPVSEGGYTLGIGTDPESKNEGYLYQNGENDVVGQWPDTQDTFGYVALTLVDTTVTPATTNYGWVHLEFNATNPNFPVLTVIDYAYETTPGSNILAGEQSYADPQIDQSPTNQTVLAGANVTMNVLALGLGSTPTYQWMAGAVGSGVYTNLPNAGVFSGADTPTLTISGVSSANQLDYVVAVTDANGSVTSSPPATLTVENTPGSVGVVPAQQIIYAGYPAQFAVTNTGAATSYSWQLNSTNLPNAGVFSGVTTSNLVISSVNSADLGNYVATVSAAGQTVTSSVATLGMVYPDGTPYEAEVLADRPVDYYRLDETSGTVAYDFVGGRNGTYGSDANPGQSAGPTPADGFPGFESTNYCASFSFDDTNNLLPCLPWNLVTDTMTMTAWIYPEYDQGNAGILYSAGDGNNVNGIRYDGGSANTNGISDGSIGYSWNNDYNTQSWNSQIAAPHDQWSLVALTVSPTAATIYIINANGVQFAVHNYPHAPATFNATEYIGTYPLEGPLGNNNFNGYIDEVAVFNSTLSQTQILNLYGAAMGRLPLTISPAPGNKLQLQWAGGPLLQATNLLGPWVTNTTATSPYIISATNAQMYFTAP